MRKYSVTYYNYDLKKNETKIVESESRTNLYKQFENNKPYTIKKIFK